MSPVAALIGLLDPPHAALLTWPTKNQNLQAYRKDTVGYVSLDEIRRAIQQIEPGVRRLVVRPEVEEDLQRVEEDALAVKKSFDLFRRQETKDGGKVVAEDKHELRRRLAKLDRELDHYLASEYGIDVNSKHGSAFDKWKITHEPFHWFVEFYRIISSGGFDIVIGNPPYVEYAKVKAHYTLRHYSTESCGNLYAFVWERCLMLSPQHGRIGMIQPVAAVCTEGYEPLQAALRSSGRSVVSNFNDRPSKLFDGLEHIRLCIILHEMGDKHTTHSTTYNKWQSIERDTLFQRLAYTDTTALNMGGAMAKVGTTLESSILAKFKAERGPIGDYEQNGKWSIFYTRKLSHFVQILDFVPSIKDETGTKREPSELKQLTFESLDHRDVFLAILNSSVFYWLLTVYSDCRNLNRREIGYVRFNFASPTAASDVEELRDLCRELMTDIRGNSKVVAMRYKGRGELRIQCTYPKFSKSIIDRIDHVLGRHLGMTPCEVDFIINYDIKYRVGQEDAEDDE